MAALEKGLAVIECFDAGHDRLTIADVARATDLSRAAARRCLLTLTSIGYAEFDGKFFRLTPRVLRLGYAWLSSTALPKLVQPFLERLSEETHESSSASLLDGHEIVYIARSAQRRIMSVGLSVGSRLPAFCTSMGRVLLAALDPEEARVRILAGKPAALTPHTVTEIEPLMAKLAEVRVQGHAIVDQELELGLVSLAMPLVNGRGQVAAAFNLSVQSQRVAGDEIETNLLPRMRAMQKLLQPLIA
ncbi:MULTISPECIES: IclR family transcriptional regulator domain-containing protein [Bosea]|jgi:IclR family pca regulon transcriptional regulator|uniref:IclR family transcriptional regulator C-terminal domain-containing protein n=1 Tax=Bosea rubneri TaxID=3075434 RepID=A0ABU3SB67_9HYPH|nr:MULTISPECIES: IclR family transcriptional regulator C-terminal domain-containing protein [unclassified Bosea (in: a-proteobacteria)]MDU0342028.1 IclR family transcriptional regulator C-terminal domain-containing protein [Bosea sp. ZW T0_25]HEV7335862.1 IclR family transcriptional regulator C-terminal domain-containing protein [Bosea sp. (in: a-proteobacteria)]